MGLDSYLYRMPRYKGVTVHDVHAIEEYLNWQREKAEGNEYADCKTLKEWCDIDESELPSQEIIDYYKQFYTKCYSDWDTKHKYGWYSIMKQVGYWRKANEIHNWFVENVQDGEDDCEYHNECTRKILEDLLHTCKIVLDSCDTTYGKIYIGDRGTDNGWEPVYEDVPGWHTPLTAVREEKDFPQAFADYIAYIEQATGTPIRIVSVGPDREATIIRA